MTIAVFLTLMGDLADAGQIYAYAKAQLLELAAASPEVISVDLYRPAPGEVALFDDGPGPPLMVQVDVAQVAHAEVLLRSRPWREQLLDVSAYPGSVEAVLVDVFETVHFKLPGQAAPAQRTAPLSFMVRYFRPTADEKAFVRFYTENHPPILATFPGIRNVLCYVPVVWSQPDHVESSGAFLGNEVVFDDLDALNAALSSDVLPELKADGARFAPFGHNSHHAMLRETVYLRDPRN